MIAGEPSPHRDIAVLNAAAALVVVGRAEDLSTGVSQACEVIDDGRAATSSRVPHPGVPVRIGRRTGGVTSRSGRSACSVVLSIPPTDLSMPLTDLPIPPTELSTELLPLPVEGRGPRSNELVLDDRRRLVTLAHDVMHGMHLAQETPHR